MQSSYGVSERRACDVFPTNRGTVRYKSRRPDQASLEMRIKDLGTVSNFVRETGFAHQRVNLSPKIMANWVLASVHSRGGRFHCSAA